jgi:hypothetical protein
MLFPTIEFLIFFLAVFTVAWLLNSRNALLDDFTPSPMITVLRAGTGALESTANSMRVSSSVDALRHKFLKQIQREN